MKKLPYIVALITILSGVCATSASENEAALGVARQAANLELQAGALDMALEEGAETALIGSQTALESALGRNLTAEETAKVKNVFRQALSQLLSPHTWVETTAKVYVRHLSEDELRDLLHFYESDTGQKVLGAQRDLSHDLGDTAERLLDEYQEEFATEVDTRLEKMFPEYGLGQVK